MSLGPVPNVVHVILDQNRLLHYIMFLHKFSQFLLLGTLSWHWEMVTWTIYKGLAECTRLQLHLVPVIPRYRAWWFPSNFCFSVASTVSAVFLDLIRQLSYP